MNEKKYLSLIIGLVFLLLLLLIVKIFLSKKKGCGCSNKKLEDLWNDDDSKNNN